MGNYPRDAEGRRHLRGTNGRDGIQDPRIHPGGDIQDEGGRRGLARPEEGGDMKKVAGILFFLSWLLCGCSIETIFESPKKSAVFIVALIVTILCAAVITIGDN